MKNNVVAVYYEERCALDDDYGKRRQIDLFASRDLAIEHLERIGFKAEGKDYVHYQYHSEVYASLHAVRWMSPLSPPSNGNNPPPQVLFGTL